MKVRSFVSTPALFVILLVTRSSCQISTSGSFFEKIQGEEIAKDPNGPIFKPAFFHCDRVSCSHVVQLKNGEYQTVSGTAELQDIKNPACVWKKHSAPRSAPLPEKVCNIEALGMESGKIPNNKITASSQMSNNPASKARLNGNSYWSPLYSDHSLWLQVDFGKQLKVTAIATQGARGYYAWTKSYEISYSNDGGHFAKIMQIFSGNTDDNGIVKNDLPAPIKARYLRIHPKDVGGYIGVSALRVEIYGCEI